MSKFVLYALACLTILGLVFAGAPLAQAQAACVETYTVVAGDTLGSIAERYLGEVGAYPQIVTATNAAAAADSSFKAIADANIIEVGQKLCIPAKSATAPTATAPTAPTTTTAPAQTGGAAAGLYTNTGPAADASNLIYLLTLDANGGAAMTQTYVSKGSFVSTGSWSQTGNAVTVNFTTQDGKANPATVVLNAEADKLTTTQDDGKVFNGATGFVLTKTPADVVALSGVYNTTLAATGDKPERFIAFTLTPDAKALFIQNPTGQDSIVETGTWTASGANATINLTKRGDADIQENFVFALQGENFTATQYDQAAWGADGLTLKRVEGIGAATAAAPTAPTAPTSPTATTTPTPGTLEGAYIASQPAADASALLWQVFLGPNGNAAWLSNYVGKGTINATGVWAQTSEDTLSLTLTRQDDRNINDKFTFQVRGDMLVATQYNESLYGSSGITLYKADGQVSGTVTYLQRIALPDDAVVEVYLLDVSAENARGEYVSGVSFRAGGQQVPLAFEVLYNTTQINPNGRYVAQAFISSNGRQLFKNDNGVAVITNGAPTSNVEIVVEQPTP